MEKINYAAGFGREMWQPGKSPVDFVLRCIRAELAAKQSGERG